MALIEYSIQVDKAKRNAKVIACVEIGQDDEIRFSSNREDTAIKFDGRSPFASPKAKKPFPVGKKTALLKVQTPLSKAPSRSRPIFAGKRKGYHFLCGHLDGNGKFQLWGGGGAHTDEI
jgi:hypothetical protein